MARLDRSPWLLLWLVLSGACARERSSSPASAAGPEPMPTPAKTPLPDAAAAAPRASFVRQRWSFEVAQIRLRVVDVEMSTRLDRVFDESRPELVVNGGFFDRRLQPQGLVFSEGKRISALSKSLSGGVLWLKGERAGLSAAEEYRERGVDFAIQGLPRLVVGSQVNVRTTPGPRAARTAICLRAGGRTLEVVIAPESLAEPGPTLRELAEELATGGCEAALNLDGGPSTGWAAPAPGSAPDAAPLFSPPRAGIRHAIVIERRTPAARSRDVRRGSTGAAP